eukprot:403360973
MNTFANLKTKIKQVNFNKINLKGAGNDNQIDPNQVKIEQKDSNPNSAQSTEVSTIPNKDSKSTSKIEQIPQNNINPYEQEKIMAKSGGGPSILSPSNSSQQNRQQISTPKGQSQQNIGGPVEGQQVPPQKTTVTFSINTMSEFSHEELQQVIIKYDAEYKRTKKTSSDQAQKMKDLEDRAIKAEKECSQLKDQNICFEENVERLKEHVQTLMQESETKQKEFKDLQFSKLEMEESFDKFRTDQEQLFQVKQFENEQQVQDLNEKIKDLQNKLALSDQIQGAQGDEDKLAQINQQQFQDYENKIKSLHDKISSQEALHKEEIQNLHSVVSDKDSSIQDMAGIISEKLNQIQDLEVQLQKSRDEIKIKVEQITKKEKMCEQFQKKLNELMNQKQEYLDKIDQLETTIKLSEDKIAKLNQENDKHFGQQNDKVHMKELVIEKINEELRQSKSTAKSQETMISYFRKKVEELTKQVEKEKNDRLVLQSEMRRIEHLSSKHSSPRNDNDDEEELDDFRKTQDLINKAQNIMDLSGKHMSTEESGQSRTGRQTYKKDSSVIIHDGEFKVDLSINKKQSSQRSNSKAKSMATNQINFQAINIQLVEDLKKLREEYDNLAREYQEIKKQKSSIEEELEQEKNKIQTDQPKLEELEDKIDKQQRTIEELEKRREQAKKEIKLLNYRLDKEKLKSATPGSQTTPSQGSINTFEEQKSQTVSVQMASISRTFETEGSIQNESLKNMSLQSANLGNYTGIDKLKRIKKDMEAYYKDLIKILFMDSVDTNVAVQMEKRINMLIMSVNDQIDEIEIRQEKEKMNSSSFLMSPKNIGEIKVTNPQQQELQRKQVPPRAGSQQRTGSQPQQQLKNMMNSILGNHASSGSGSNPYSSQQMSNKPPISGSFVMQSPSQINNHVNFGASAQKIGLPPQSSSASGRKDNQPVKGMHQNTR